MRITKLPYQSRQCGFTLVEAVLVILITGIVGAMVAVFMKSPVDAYFDTARRAALADEADTAVRRIARDIRKALPNSVRPMNVNSSCIEFIPTKTGGRYRAEQAGASGDILNFAVADSSFDMLGLSSDLPQNQQIVPGDVIAVSNFGESFPGLDAYAGDNTAVVEDVLTSVTSPPETVLLPNENRITFSSPKQFPAESDSSRFHVIPGNETIVSYVCSGGLLYRNSNYAYNNSCPAPVPGATPVLASHVSSCNFLYSPSNTHNALVKITLGLTQGGETVTLYHEVHVNNTP